METCKGLPGRPHGTLIKTIYPKCPLHHLNKATLGRQTSSQLLTAKNGSNTKQMMESFCGHPHQYGGKEIKGKGG